MYFLLYFPNHFPIELKIQAWRLIVWETEVWKRTLLHISTSLKHKRRTSYLGFCKGDGRSTEAAGTGDIEEDIVRSPAAPSSWYPAPGG